jgi:hypothetical protein
VTTFRRGQLKRRRRSQEKWRGALARAQQPGQRTLASTIIHCKVHHDRELLDRIREDTATVKEVTGVAAKRGE